MTDNLSVLLTCVAVVLVAWRAVRMDAAQPWFGRRRRPAGPPRPSPPGRPRG
jgi:hypothetical protein